MLSVVTFKQSSPYGKLLSVDWAHSNNNRERSRGNGTKKNIQPETLIWIEVMKRKLKYTRAYIYFAVRIKSVTQHAPSRKSERRNINFWRFSAKLTLLLFHSHRDACAPPDQKHKEKVQRAAENSSSSPAAAAERAFPFLLAKESSSSTEKSLGFSHSQQFCLWQKKWSGEWVFPR